MELNILAHAFAFLLAMVHPIAPKLRFLEAVPRSRWLSLAGGIAVAYVFMHVLPDLHETQHALEEAGAAEWMERVGAHAYLVALVGLCTFYGLERLAVRSRDRSQARTGADQTEPEVFWIHLVAFGVYNAIVGYLLLHRETKGLSSLVFYFIAILLHFVVNDYGLREHHKERYRSYGRWLLAGSLLAGWICGLLLSVPRFVVGLLFAFLAGGVMMNVLKEELPKERQSRFDAFAAGAIFYSALLILV